MRNIIRNLPKPVMFIECNTNHELVEIPPNHLIGFRNACGYCVMYAETTSHHTLMLNHDQLRNIDPDIFDTKKVGESCPT